MEKRSLNVVWTEPAKKDIQNIFDYLDQISPVIADNQIDRIINRIDLLEQGYPNIGQREPLLESKKADYRYLVQDHYKIIYHQANYDMIIDMIFDTRQNPVKMKKKL